MAVRRKPLVGLNMDFRSAKIGGFSCISSHYPDAILRAGGIPLLIPPLEDRQDIDRVLDTVSALVLVGGADLDCRMDGYHLHESMRILDPRREKFDRLLVRRARDAKVPVLGIGCGMQLLNITFGGTLFLDLPTDRPGGISHCEPREECNRHGLVSEPNSLMFSAYGELDTFVPSMHHQAVDDLSPCFRVTGRSPDGVVEAIEHERGWLAVGTQFHPEHHTARAIDNLVFSEFLLRTSVLAA